MRAHLVMFTPEGTRRDFEIMENRRYLIGRKESCDLRLPLHSVSREHAAVYWDDDEELVIEDLGSSNGTYVNEEKVKKTDLCPGDVVVIGPVPLQVVINGHPKDLKPLPLVLTGKEDGADSETTDDKTAPAKQPTAKKAANAGSGAEDDSFFDFDFDEDD